MGWCESANSDWIEFAAAMSVFLRGTACYAEDNPDGTTTPTVEFSQTISGVTEGANAVITFSTAMVGSPFGVGSQLYISGTGTNMDGNTVTVTANGGSAGAWTSTTSFTTSSSSNTGTAAIQVQDGDVLIAFTDNNPAEDTTTMSFPSGWTVQVSDVEVNASEGASIVYIATMVAGASPPTNLALTVTAATLLYANVRIYGGASSNFTAVSTGPVASEPMPVTFSLDSASYPANSIVAAFFGTGAIAVGTDTLTWDPPGGWGNDAVSMGSYAVPYATNCFSCDQVFSSSGSTGTVGGSLSDEDGNDTGYYGYLVVLSPPTIIQLPWCNYVLP